MEQKTADKAAQALLERAEKEKIGTIWDRWEAMQPFCKYGKNGICCTICNMGPCQIRREGMTGVCGATAEVIVARNLVRKIAAGCAAHSDHGRGIAETLLLTALGKTQGYKITDEDKLRMLASEYGIKTENKNKEKIAEEVARIALAEFGKSEGELKFLKRAPQKQQDTWHKLHIAPRAVDREIVESLHRTNMGVDNDYHSLLLHGLRTALADGWGGSMIATEISDILFRSPRAIRAQVNLGILKENEVNIIVHGHEPLLAELIVQAANDPEMIALAKEEGAEGINLAGICCTANEILMRHGIAAAGNFLHQELAIITGAVEVMVVDIQCILPTLPSIAQCFHTKIFSTSDKAKFLGAEHIEFKEDRGYTVAKEIVGRAIENYKNRDKNRVYIPTKETAQFIAGFTTEYIFDMLGGKYRATYRPLNNGIMDGRLRGVVGVVGCNYPGMTQDLAHLTLVKELLKKDVLVVETGCAALACAKGGLMTPEAAFKYAGKGLQEICKAVGIPPVLHLGACVDNSRILTACCEMVKEGGIGKSIDELPVAGAALEWMSEKAITIGFYAVASGIFTVFGLPQPVMGSDKVYKYITEEIENLVGGKYAFQPDPVKAAELIIEHLNKKRKALNLAKMMYD
ncbi:MAG TPA: carbon-monoxide dehydrogenase catalytic subunit [Elusimicrobia bacterium]|nr:carbon-monoxide dehydrogenase catalytic subunit [Elusimicrobiota bacterium]